MALADDIDRTAPDGPRTRIGLALRRLVAEPMLHFLIVGLLVFVAYALVAPAPPAPVERIVIAPEQLARLDAQFQATWSRPPTEQERAGLLREYLREEVLYREAVQLGLDRDDSVVRQRLRQKMEYLAMAAVEPPEPSEADLRSLRGQSGPLRLPVHGELRAGLPG